MAAIYRNWCTRIARTNTGLVVCTHQNTKFCLVCNHINCRFRKCLLNDLNSFLFLFWDRESGEVSYANTENMLTNIGNVDVMPVMQDGFNFTLSEYLGSDIYQMQPDLQPGVCHETAFFFSILVFVQDLQIVSQTLQLLPSIFFLTF